MSYVKRVLQPGEEVRHTTNIHWINYWWGVLLLLAALAVYLFARTIEWGREVGMIAALSVLAVACGFLAYEWFTRWNTEIAVTDRRVILKQGFISRDTKEMNLDKVERVEVNQSILGRILDYGKVTIVGTGEGRIELQTIDKPLDLRNHITGVVSVGSSG